MTILDDKTVVVYNSNELKTVLEQDNTYELIYFGDNIKLQSRIDVLPSKTNIIIDGTYNNIRYTYEDMDSIGYLDTIGIRSASSMNFTWQNIDINGRNYYGITFVYESNSTSNVTLNYINIKYTGPQITYHVYGLSRYINSEINIQPGYSPNNELAECNRIEIGGNTTMNHISSSNSMFWFRGVNSQYFKVLPNSNVNITTTNRELFYGTNNLSMIFEENSMFVLSAANGVCYNDYECANVEIKKNATVSITQTSRNGAYSTWYVDGTFSVEENSEFYMTSNYSGITSSNYNLRFISGSTLTINKPRRIRLYNGNTNAIYTAGTSNFNFNISQFNRWINAKTFVSAGDIYDIPNYSWYKFDNSIISLIGTFTSTNTNIQSNNFTTDEVNKLPPLTNFQLSSSPVVSIGKSSLNLYPITESTTIFKGQASPNDDVLIEFNSSKVYVKADANGNFEYDNTTPLLQGDIIKFTDNFSNSFIYTIREVEVVYPGELTLDKAPETFTFILNSVSTSPILCPREDDFKIVVTDSRVNSTEWKLYATLTDNPISNNGYTLTDSIVHRNSDNTIDILNSTPTLVYTGLNNQGLLKITNVNWEIDKGILLQLENEPLQNGETYRTNIIWTLEE